LFRNVYIVNEDLEVQDFGMAEGENSKSVNSIEINYNDNPITIAPHGGVVASVSYLPVIEKLLQSKKIANMPPIIKRHCLRTTIITKKPLLVSEFVRGKDQDYGSLATFTVAPQIANQAEGIPYIGNVNPIRIY